MPTDILSATSGELQQTGWNLPANMTYEQWSGAAEILNRVDNARQWWIGDWWNAGVEWGKGQEACEANELNYQTTSDCGAIASMFDITRRRVNLTFNHHKELRNIKDQALQDRFLDWCENDEHGNPRAKRKSIRDLREAIKAYLDDQDWTDDQRERKTALQNGEAVLLNMTNGADEKLIEWAKFNGVFVRIDRNSIWGNPFELPGDGDRDTVCNNYATYLAMKPSLLKRLPELKGKALACWCCPDRCHGETLLDHLP